MEAAVRDKRDFGDGGGRAAQAPRGSFEQQPATHFSGRFLDQRAEDAVELRAALIGQPREFTGAAFHIERGCYCLGESRCVIAIHDRNLAWSLPGVLDSESQI